MTNRIKYAALASLAICLMQPAATLASADVEFDFADIHQDHGFGSQVGSGSSMSYYLDGNQTGTGVGVSISGWQAYNSNYTFQNRTNRLRNLSNKGIGLDYYESGWQESIDNRGRFDLVIFEFDELVSLDRIDLGWVGSDYDFTLLAHTGPTDPVLANNRFGYREGFSRSLTSLGWDLIGHYAENVSSSVAVNVSNVVSNFWAIGAYTSAIVDASRTYGSPDNNSDYFRLRTLAANLADGAQAVSEPGSVALLGIGLLALLRRQTRKNAATTTS